MAQRTRALSSIFFTALTFLTLPLATLPADDAAAQTRLRATGVVTFYAAPSGIDAYNNCLSAVTPCTVQGAHAVAKRDWDFANGGCEIRLAQGTYTGDGATVAVAGTYVGTHLCQVWGDVTGPDNACVPGAPNVVFEVPAGRAAFDIQDLAMTSIRGVTFTGQGLALFGRQFVVIDLACIHCKDIAACAQVTHHTVMNFGLDNWISGAVDGLVGADRTSTVTIAGNSKIKALSATSVRYLFLSYNKSDIYFAPGSGGVANQNLITGVGQAKPDCIAVRGGSIDKGGLSLPCNEYQFGGTIE